MDFASRLAGTCLGGASRLLLRSLRLLLVVFLGATVASILLALGLVLLFCYLTSPRALVRRPPGPVANCNALAPSRLSSSRCHFTAQSAFTRRLSERS